jgi:hypothetical protein
MEVFKNSNNEKIKYELNIETKNIAYDIKNNKIVITNSNKAKIEYKLFSVNKLKKEYTVKYTLFYF